MPKDFSSLAISCTRFFDIDPFETAAAFYSKRRASSLSNPSGTRPRNALTSDRRFTAAARHPLPQR
jgi:hypothetical protein